LPTPVDRLRIARLQPVVAEPVADLLRLLEREGRTADGEPADHKPADHEPALRLALQRAVVEYRPTTPASSPAP
jgi:hypothetical protein